MTPVTTVAVIGGGPAGAACARELASAGHAVRLFADGDGTGPPLGETAGPPLIRLLWSGGLTLPPACGTSLESFAASWEDEGLADVSAGLRDVTAAHALDRPAFDRWLRDEAARAGAIISQPARATRVEPDGDGWRVFVRGEMEECVAARFVVEATGRGARSVCHPEVGRHYTDRLIGISVDVTAPVAGTAEAAVEAGEGGWWYYLAVAGRPFVCYFTDADDVPPAGGRSGWLVAHLHTTRHIRERVAAISADDVQIWDARTSIRSVLWRGSWLVIGDAAWTMDPLSGAGVERALQSGIDAGRAVAAALIGGTQEPLRDFAIRQVNSFRETADMQRRVYSNVTRFTSRFWSRRTRQM